MGRLISFVLISILFSAHSSAESCSTVDESQSQFIGPMDDQGEYNTCYAFVGSYLVGHYLKTEINPEHIAVRNEYYNDDNKASSVEAMMKEGIGQVAYSVNSQVSYGFLLECGNNDKAKLQTELDPLSYLSQLEKNCPIIQKKLEVVRNSVEEVGRDEAANRIDALLDKNQISAVFGTPRFFKGFEGEDGSWFHVMTVVGRRFNDKTQSCEYVLRNTRGPDVHIDMKVHGPYNYRYENGHFIVNRAYLKDFMSGIYFVKD